MQWHPWFRMMAIPLWAAEMKLNVTRSVTVVAIAFFATTASAQSTKKHQPVLSPAQKLQQIGTFSARTPVGVDLARKPGAGQLAQPNPRVNKRRSFQSRQRAVVRPQR
jgi:hypothetical protein